MTFPSVFWSMAFILLILTYIISGCEKTSNVSETKPTATLIKYSDCKNNAGILSDTVLNNQDCIEYNYNNKERILKLKHINAGFNCCPGNITADISINNDAIILNEKEQNAGCHCNCLFDIEYEIKNFSSMIFKIVVVEPYRPVNEDVLEFNVDLNIQPTGKFCVERNNYPWNMN